jgi:hypothetical protein
MNNNTMPSQADEVYEFMQKHGSITHRQAEDYIGCMRLASRIYELKKKGRNIIRETVRVKARNGRETYIARYKIA